MYISLFSQESESTAVVRPRNYGSISGRRTTIFTSPQPPSPLWSPSSLPISEYWMLFQYDRSVMPKRHLHLQPRLKKEYIYTSTSPLGLHGLFQSEFTFTFFTLYVYVGFLTSICVLTFRHRASCIQDRRFTTLQRTLFIYLINKYISLSDICLTVHH